MIIEGVSPSSMWVNLLCFDNMRECDSSMYQFNEFQYGATGAFFRLIVVFLCFSIVCSASVKKPKRDRHV